MTGINDLFLQEMEKLSLDPASVQLTWQDDILILSGCLKCWQQVVDVGHMAAKLPGVKKLVNHLTSEDAPKKEKRDIKDHHRPCLRSRACFQFRSTVPAAEGTAGAMGAHDGPARFPGAGRGICPADRGHRLCI